MVKMVKNGQNGQKWLKWSKMVEMIKWSEVWQVSWTTPGGLVCRKCTQKCCCTTVALLRTVVALLLHCCYTSSSVVLLLHFCCTAVALLSCTSVAQKSKSEVNISICTTCNTTFESRHCTSWNLKLVQTCINIIFQIHTDTALDIHKMHTDTCIYINIHIQ